MKNSTAMDRKPVQEELEEKAKTMGKQAASPGQAQQELDRERRQLLSIFDSIDEPIYVSDPDTYELLYVNNAMKHYVGNVTGKKCHEALQALDSPCPFCTNASLFGEHAVQSYVYQIQNRRTGRWYRCMDKAIRWPDGRMARCEVAVDISERMHTEKLLQEAHDELRKANEQLRKDIEKRELIEKKLAESEAKYRMAAENIHDGIWMCGTDLRFSYSSPSHSRLLGYTIEETLGRSLFFSLVPEQRKQAENEVHKALDMLEKLGPGSVRLQVRRQEHFRKDGQRVWLEVQSSFLHDAKGRFQGFLGVARDITQRVQAENALAESEARYRDLIDCAMNIIYTVDTEGRFLEANQAFFAESGYEPSEITGKRFDFLVHPDDMDTAYAAFGKCLAGQSCSFEMRVTNKEGRTGWYSFTNRPIKREDGSTKAIHGIVHDISRRKVAEQDLIESQELYYALFEAMPDATVLIDPATGQILDANQEATDLLERPYPELIGMHYTCILPPELEKQSQELFADARKALKDGEHMKPVAYTVLRAGGTRVPVWIHARQFTVHGKSMLLSFFHRREP